MRASIGLILLLTLIAAPADAQLCEKPNMMIVQDRSGSMSGTKWTQAKNAIQYILNNYGNSLRFGLDMYNSDDYCGAGNIQVSVGDNTATAIMNALNGTSPNGMTPTAATLMGLLTVRDLKAIDRRNFVLLVTDGCDTCCTDQAQDPVTATASLYANGIRTYVIGFGLGSGDCSNWDSILTNMAVAGHTSGYHFADDQASLQQAMDQIIAEALTELCDDRDNNCDGNTDETWSQKGELCTITQGGCVGEGVYVCNAAQDGVECNAQINATPEVCDGLDNDCDGVVDNGFPDQDTDGYTTCTDCDDNNPAVNPGATEICNGIDDDCDGAIDEDDPTLGDPCGTGTDEGECQRGVLMCVDGSMDCVGEIGPVPEINCDGLDNDCDGTTDMVVAEICDDGIDNDCDGLIDSWDPDCGAVCEPGDQRPCGESEGACEEGVETCRNGQWGPCEGELGPSEEVCDGQDNDCDGDTDENAVDEICDNGIDDDCDGLIDGMDPDCGECTPGEQRPCGTDEGECRQGIQTCNSLGRWGECAGEIGPTPEQCDLMDNDCDGITDEGHLCEGYDACLCGECAPPCSAGECPAGSLTCVNGWCVSDPCCGVSCPPGEMCDENGHCADPCVVEQIQCGQDEDCRLGICVPADCLTAGHECPDGERCVDGVCEADPCAGVDCPAGEYCREGVCEGVACSDCTADQVCEDGQCVDSPCAGIRCEAGQECIDGECAADPCQGVHCPQGTTCIDGTCEGDPCLNIECPADSECQEGFCVSTEQPPQDAGTDAGGGDDAGGTDAGGDQGGDEVTDAGTDAGTDSGGPSDQGGGGGEGCSCGSGGSPQFAGLFLLLAGMLLIRRRR